MTTQTARLLLTLLVGFGLGCPSSDDGSTDDASAVGGDVAATGGTSVLHSGSDAEAAGGTSVLHSGGSYGAGSGGMNGSSDGGGVTKTDAHGVCSTGGAGGDNCGTTTCRDGQCCCRGACIPLSDSCL